MIEYDSNSSTENLGVCALEYGPTSSGKTFSALTLPEPILHISKEPKDPRTVHGTNHGINIKYCEPENFDDIMAFLNDLIAQARAGTLKYKGIFHDGLTFGNVLYRQAVEDDRYAARKGSKDDKPRAGMIDRFRFERADWGTIATMMARETFLLNKLSKFGVLVVSTAISTEYPKWNSSIRMAPSLSGQEFGRIVHGYFDMIGFITEPFKFDQYGKPVLPRVSFLPREDDIGLSYMARCSSTRLAEMEAKAGPAPLNWTKILKVIRGR